MDFHVKYIFTVTFISTLSLPAYSLIYDFQQDIVYHHTDHSWTYLLL